MPNFWNWQRRTANQSEGSAALAVVEELHPIQFYTRSGMVTAQVAPNGRRMLDILNEAPQLRLTEVEHLSFREDNMPMRVDEWASVDVETIVLATPPPQVSPRQLRIHRRQRRVNLEVPPFTVVGNAHIPPGFKLNDFLSRQRERFIPITEALLRNQQYPMFDRSVSVVLVNVSEVSEIRDLLA